MLIPSDLICPSDVEFQGAGSGISEPVRRWSCPYVYPYRTVCNKLHVTLNICFDCRISYVRNSNHSNTATASGRHWISLMLNLPASRISSTCISSHFLVAYIPNRIARGIMPILWYPWVVICRSSNICCVCWLSLCLLNVILLLCAGCAAVEKADNGYVRWLRLGVLGVRAVGGCMTDMHTRNMYALGVDKWTKGLMIMFLG